MNRRVGRVIEVITGRERCRWSIEKKFRIVVGTFEPGAPPGQIFAHHDIYETILQKLRHQAGSPANHAKTAGRQPKPVQMRLLGQSDHPSMPRRGIDVIMCYSAIMIGQFPD